MTNKFRIAFFSLALTFSSTAATANVCVDAFKGERVAPTSVIPENVEISGLRIVRDSSPQEVKDTSDPRYRESLKNLLAMLTDTQFQSISKKETLEKGELRLAKTFDDGLSIEFEYEGDKRSSSRVFNLSKIILVKPNGQTETIDKNPIPDSGLQIPERTIFVAKETKDETTTIKPLDKTTVAAWAKDEPTVLERVNSNRNPVAALAQAQERLSESNTLKLARLQRELQTVNVPFKLEGVMLEGLLNWTSRVPHLDCTEMRNNLAQDRVERLIWRSRFNGSVRWMGKELQKLGFRELIRTAVLVGIVYNLMPNAAPHQAVPAPVAQTRVETAALNQREAHLLAALVRSTEASNSEHLMQNINSRVRPETAAQIQRERQAVLDTVGELTKREAAANGSPLVYTGTGSTLGVQLTAQARNSNLVISLFPIQQKMLIVPDAQKTSMSAIVITRAENPALYDQVALRLESLYSQGQN